jgi:hypothetical protein
MLAPLVARQLIRRYSTLSKCTKIFLGHRIQSIPCAFFRLLDIVVFNLVDDTAGETEAYMGG